MAFSIRIISLSVALLLGWLPMICEAQLPSRVWISRSGTNPLPLAMNAGRVPEVDLLQSTNNSNGEDSLLHLWIQPPRDASGNYLTVRYFKFNVVGTSWEINLENDFNVLNPSTTVGGVTTSRWQMKRDSTPPDPLNTDFVVTSIPVEFLGNHPAAMQERVDGLGAVGYDFNDLDNSYFTGVGPASSPGTLADPSGSIPNAGLCWRIATFSVRSLPVAGAVDFRLQLSGEGVRLGEGPNAATQVIFAPPGSSGPIYDSANAAHLNTTLSNPNGTLDDADLIVRSGATLVGDFSGDGRVDGSDFLRWQRGYSASTMTAAQLWAWKNNVGRLRPAPTGVAVPEPTGWSILAMGAVLGMCRPPQKRRLNSDLAANEGGHGLRFALALPGIVRSLKGAVPAHPSIHALGTRVTKVITVHLPKQLWLLVVVFVSLSLCAASAHAQLSFAWDGSSGTGWGLSANWTPSPSPVSDLNGANLTFNASGVSGPQTINLNGDRSPRKLIFRSADPVRIQGGSPSGELTVGAGGIEVQVGAGVVNIDAPVTVGNANGHWINNSQPTNGSTRLFINGRVNLGGRELTVGGAGTTEIAGNLRSGGSLVKAGSGRLVLSGATNSTTAGRTTIDGGTLDISSPSNLLNGELEFKGGAIWLNNGGSFGSRDLKMTGNGTIDTRGSNSTFSGAISGNGTLTKDGGGTLHLSVGTSTFGGAVVINGGTFETFGSTLPQNITNNSFLSIVGGGQYAGAISGGGTAGKYSDGTLVLTGNNTYSGPTAIYGGSLQVGNGGISGTLGSGGVQIAAGANLTFNRSDYYSYGAAITGGGSLIKYGGDQLVLQHGGNNYTGGTYVYGGTLHGNSDTLKGYILNNATVLFNNTFSGTYAGAMEGAGNLQKHGGGTLTLSGANGYTGYTAIIGGTLQLANDNRISDSSAVSIDSGALLALNNNSDTIGSLSGAGGVSLGSGHLAAGANGSHTHYSGVISGSGSFTKVGSGHLTLFGDNSYSGATNINGGQLVWGAHNVISDSSTVVVNGGMLNLNGLSDIIGGLAGAGPVVLGGGTLAVGANGTNTSYSGALSGAGSFAKVGGGSLSLTGNLSGFSGNYRLQGGTLVVGAGLSMGTGTNISFEGGALNMGQAVQTNRSVSLSGVSTVISEGFEARLNGQITGNGTLVKTGGGDLWLTASNNNYSGGTRLDGGRLFVRNGGFGSGPLTINGGTLFTGVTSSSSDPLFGAVTFNGAVALNAGTSVIDTYSNGATFNGVVSGNGKLHKTGWGTLILNGVNTYTGGNEISLHYLQGNTQSIKGNVSFVANGLSKGVIFNQTSNGTFSPRIMDEGSVTKTGAGTLELWGYNTYSSGTAIQQGALLGDSASFGTGPISISSGASLIFQQNVTGEFASNVTGLGNLRKTGTADLKLSGANNISGSVAIEGGKLQVNGNIAGSVTVSPGATLGGKVNIGGSVTGGGRVSPGNSPGILTINGDYTQTTNSFLDIEIERAGAPATPGVDYDQLRVGGTARLAGNINFIMYNGYVPTAGDTFRFIDTLPGGDIDPSVRPNLFTPGLQALNDADKYTTDPLGLNDLGIRVFVDADKADVQYFSKGNASFDDDLNANAQWILGSSWSTNQTPKENDSTTVSNRLQFDELQTVTIAETTNVEVYDLLVKDPASPIKVEALAGSHLKAVTGNISIGDNGAIDLVNGSLLVEAAKKVDVTGTGTLSGVGSIQGAVHVGTALGSTEATFKPASDSSDSLPGMSITGSYTQGAGGVFSADLADSVAGGFDTVSVSGNVSLQGTLSINAPTVEAGDVFTLVSGATGNGAFDRVEAVAPAGLYFKAFYGDLPTVPGIATASSSTSATYLAGAQALPMGDANGDLLVNLDDARVFAAVLLDNNLSGFTIRAGNRASNNFQDAFDFSKSDALGDIRYINHLDIAGFKAALAKSSGISMHAASRMLGLAMSNVSIPEPHSGLLLVSGACIVAARSRRTRRAA